MNRLFTKVSAMLIVALTLPTVAAFASSNEAIPVDAQPWPGPDTTVTVTDLSFMANSSGLDFYNNRLYAVDNSPGTLYVMEYAPDGTLTFAEGYENGKPLAFADDADNPSAGGPDSEGVTADESGYVYIMSERDSDNSKVNSNVILMVDPSDDTDRLVALRQWDITSLLPDARANRGAEAVEWVSLKAVTGVLTDENTGLPFSPEDYPDLYADGIFFVGMESNGHVYALALNEDGSAVLLADIDTGLGAVMALDYDTLTGQLWAVADSAVNNIAAVLDLASLSITYYDPAGMDTDIHNEGFAIANITLAKDNTRPVFHFCDGVSEGALSITYLNTEEQPHISSTEPASERYPHRVNADYSS